MKVTVVKTDPAQCKSDLTVYFVRQGQKKKAPLCADQDVAAMVGRAFAAGDFSGKAGQTFLYYPEKKAKAVAAAARILVVGLGKELDRETVRTGAGTAAVCALKTKALK